MIETDKPTRREIFLSSLLLSLANSPSLDPFSLQQNGLATSEVDVGRGEIVEALVIAPVVVVLDEGGDLGFEVTRQELVFQQDAVLQGLMPAFDLALGLGVAVLPANCSARRVATEGAKTP